MKMQIVPYLGCSMAAMIHHRFFLWFFFFLFQVSSQLKKKKREWEREECQSRASTARKDLWLLLSECRTSFNRAGILNISDHHLSFSPVADGDHTFLTHSTGSSASSPTSSPGSGHQHPPARFPYWTLQGCKSVFTPQIPLELQIHPSRRSTVLFSTFLPHNLLHQCNPCCLGSRRPSKPHFLSSVWGFTDLFHLTLVAEQCEEQGKGSRV